jgi:hypothetical protein
MSTLFASMNAAQRLRRATDWSALKVNESPVRLHHTWHHSVNRTHIFCHAKFEVGFVILLTEKIHVKQKVVFSWVIFPLSKTRGFKNSASFWFSELEDVTLCLCR